LRRRLAMSKLRNALPTSPGPMSAARGGRGARINSLPAYYVAMVCGADGRQVYLDLLAGGRIARRSPGCREPTQVSECRTVRIDLNYITLKFVTR
jgi:hypothetical protein